MANPTRTPGRRGLLPRDHSRPAPVFEDFLIPGEPIVVPRGATVDYASLVTDWPMFCNGPDPGNPPGSPDGVGDCTIAGPGHFFMAQSAYAGLPIPVFADSAIITAYSAQNGYNPQTGANDNGADMQSVCQYLVSTGLVDVTGKAHKLAFYSALRDPASPASLKAALDLTGTVYLGISCPQSAEDQFSAGQALTYVPGSPVVGGHAVVIQKILGGGNDVYELVTWGATARCTLGFIAHYVGQGAGQAWAVGSYDFIRATGVSPSGYNMQGLLAATAALS